MRQLYNFITYCIIPFLFLRLFFRSFRMRAYRLRWTERLGFSPKCLKCIWFHSVSVGETIASVPLIQACLEAFPNLPILVTTITPTGSERVQSLLGAKVTHCYLPYDTPGAIKRFLTRVNPVMGVVMETELWPNVLHYAAEKNIPMMLANARLSAKSANGYGKLPMFVKRMMMQLHHVMAQTKADGERFLALGLPRDRLSVFGSVKFDISIPQSVLEQAQALRAYLGCDRPIWIAASTHAGEEELICEAHKAVLKQFPNALLVLVPRHPDRFEKVASLVSQQGFSMCRRSIGEPCTEKTRVFLGDTMGELLLFYAVSDVAFVAGSLVPVGCHNVLEPAALAKPILCGPERFNFLDITQMLEQAGALQEIGNAEALASSIMDLFQHPNKRVEMGQKGLSVLDANRGAVPKQFAIIKSKLEEII